MVASVSPSATVYDSPAAGDGLGDGLGEGEGGDGTVGLLAGDGLATGGVAPAGVGVGGAPPTQPQAVTSTVPTISA